MLAQVSVDSHGAFISSRAVGQHWRHWAGEPRTVKITSPETRSRARAAAFPQSLAAKFEKAQTTPRTGCPGLGRFQLLAASKSRFLHPRRPHFPFGAWCLPYFTSAFLTRVGQGRGGAVGARFIASPFTRRSNTCAHLHASASADALGQGARLRCASAHVPASSARTAIPLTPSPLIVGACAAPLP